MNNVIACEDLDFMWTLTDIKLCKSMWIQGFSIWDMARALERDVDEVTLLIIDLSRKEEIQNRVGGARGKRL